MKRSTTPNIQLKPLTVEDAASIAKLVNDNFTYLRRWLPWLNNSYTTKDSLTFIQETIDQKAAGRGYQVGIWWQDSFVGVVGFHSWESRHKRASLGYWLAEKAQHHGIMTEAVRILVEDAFSKYGMHRLEIRTATTNIRSQGVPRRLGFIKEATLAEAEWLRGKPLDIVIFRLLAPEWIGHP